MGSLFGALLVESGEQVTLLDIHRDHVDAINTDGLEIETADSRRCVRIQATADPSRIDPAELCLIFVKSTHTAEAATVASRLAGPATVVLTLQNGMGNAETLAETLGPSRVIAGTTAHGATFLGPGSIRHAGSGDTIIGPWSTESMAAVHTTANVFNRAGITTRVVTDVRRVMWSKLFINVGINAITALTGITNGQLNDLGQTRQLAGEAVAEALAVARALGVDVNDHPIDTVFRVAQATGTNRSSMGQDVDNRRLTEIDAINGFIVKMASPLGLPVPVNRTLTALVETLQAHY